MTRGGQDKDRDGPERRCIVTGDVQPKAGLLRFVLSPDGTVVPDLAEKLPGRGIWVSADRDILAKAAARGLFARAAKAPAQVPADLVDQVGVVEPEPRARVEHHRLCVLGGTGDTVQL